MIWIDSPLTPTTPRILDSPITQIATFSSLKRVFWVQDSEGGQASVAIMSASLNESRIKTTVQSGFSSHIAGIAIDWMSRNIYWSQQKLGRIEVSRLDGGYRRIIIKEQPGIEIYRLKIDPIRR